MIIELACRATVRRYAELCLLGTASTFALATAAGAAPAPQTQIASNDAAAAAGADQARDSSPLGPNSIDPEEGTLGEIVVTGSALRNRAEVAARKSSVAIVDTLSRDEVGSLPDITIAESMRRITGVTTIQ